MCVCVCVCVYLLCGVCALHLHVCVATACVQLLVVSCCSLPPCLYQMWHGVRGSE